MSEIKIKAIYADGVFQPTIPGEVILPDGQEVELLIKKIYHETDAETAARVEQILDLIAHFYDGLEESEIDEIERSMRRRVNFFGPEDEISLKEE